MKYILFCLYTCCWMILQFAACTETREVGMQSADYPLVFPDYVGVTVPRSVAPLNFQVDDAEAVKADFSDSDGKIVFTVTGMSQIRIPKKRWKQLLSTNAEILVKLSVWNQKHPEGIAYRPFPIFISSDSIDSHIVYRLIDPGYEPWNQMGIYQRELASYKETSIVDNHRNTSMCINCHTFYQYNPSTFLFHRRGEDGGTIFVKGEEVYKINLALLGKKKQGVYPSWHPGGRYVVFSSNQTHQSFTGQGDKVLEVYDIGSDLILYDMQTREVLMDERFNDNHSWETFPSWSPDGKFLYFCTTPAIEAETLPHAYTTLKYALVRVGFSEETGTFMQQTDTLYHPAYRGGSISHPRVSPDGRYLLYTEASSGTFPIWHTEAELRMIDLIERRELDTRILNSPEAESFHSWSSNGRWIVFVSRRMDGRHTRLYIAHVGADGTLGKPFLLPQRNPEENLLRIQSYNVPEFVNGKVRYQSFNP